MHDRVNSNGHVPPRPAKQHNSEKLRRDHLGRMPAEQWGTMVAIAIEHSNFARARRIIDEAEREAQLQLDARPSAEDLPLAALEFDNEGMGLRITNALEHYLHIVHVSSLMLYTREELMQLPGIGAEALKALAKAMRLEGFSAWADAAERKLAEESD